MRSRRRRRVVAAVAAAFGIAWIVVILPALSPASFRPDRVPGLLGVVRDWRNVVLGFGERIGSAAAAMASMAWAWRAGALDPEIGLAKPWKVESWILDVFGFGGVFGALVVAALPPWAIWWVSRIVRRRPIGPRTPALSLVRALRGAADAVRRSPAGWALLAGLALIGGHAIAGAEGALGRHGDLPSLAGVLANAAVGVLVGLASVRLGLALVDARPLDAGDLLGGPARVATYAVTAGATSALGFLGCLLGVLPGIAFGVTFGFAPFVVADEAVRPLHAFARSAALTRGARWRVLGAGLALAGPSGAIVNVLTRFGTATAASVVSAVVLAPLSVLVGCHVYRQLVVSLPAMPTEDASLRGWRDPALAVAAAWTVALLVPFGWGVLERVRHPNPAWLMLPPVRGDRADITAPLSAWCAYSQHGSASGCEWALGATRDAFGVDGYAFGGARCVPVAEADRPSMRERMLAHLEGMLGPMLEADAEATRSEHVGDDVLDLVFVAKGDDGTPLPVLGIDVDERDTSELDHERVARLAAAGLPEYWHVSEPHGAFPAMLVIWSEPIPAQRAYASQRGWGGNGGDPELKPIRLGDGRFAVNDLVPPVCPPRPAGESPPPPGCDGRLAFVVDGTSAAPSFQLSRDGGSEEPTGFRFAAVSSAPPGADPEHDGLAVQVHAVHPAADPIEAVLPPGPAWTEETPGRAWRYHDGRGRAGGVTDVRVARVGPDASRLAWGVEARLAPEAANAAVRSQWSTLTVTLTLDPQSDAGGACGEVFFPVGAGRCALDAPEETIRCSVASPAAECVAEDADGMARCAIEETARAQDAYFARRGLYFSGACRDLPGVTARTGITCTTNGTAASFTVTAVHPQMKQACTLDSAKRDRGVECS